MRRSCCLRPDPRRLLLDQNLSPQTTAFLRSLGHDATDLRELGKAGVSDVVVYETAQREGRILVTYDLDFSRRFMAQPDLEGLIQLRVHPQTLENLHARLKDFLQRMDPDDVRGAIAIVENDRYRLRKVRSDG